VDHAFADVEVGSYPKFGDEDHKVRLTFDAREADRLEAAMDHLLSLVAEKDVVRVQREQ